MKGVYLLIRHVFVNSIFSLSYLEDVIGITKCVAKFVTQILNRWLNDIHLEDCSTILQINSLPFECPLCASVTVRFQGYNHEPE